MSSSNSIGSCAILRLARTATSLDPEAIVLMLLLVYSDMFFTYVSLDSLSESEVSFAFDSCCVCADPDYFRYCFCNASQLCLLLYFDEGMLYLNRLLTS